MGGTSDDLPGAGWILRTQTACTVGWQVLAHGQAPVIALGLEPRTYGLKGRCSTD